MFQFSFFKLQNWGNTNLGGDTGVEEILAQDREYNQFDEIIGCIEDIVIEQQFQDLQESFLEKHYHHFDIGTEENKLIYMEIFQVRFMNILTLEWPNLNSWA